MYLMPMISMHPLNTQLIELSLQLHKICKVFEAIQSANGIPWLLNKQLTEE